MQSMDREARYVVLRGMVEDLIETQAKRKKLTAADAALARAQGLAMLDIVVSLIEAVHRIADAQEAMAQSYAA